MLPSSLPPASLALTAVGLVVPLALSSNASAEVASFFLTDASLRHYASGSGYVPYAQPFPTVNSIPIPNGINLFGSTDPVSGDAGRVVTLLGSDYLGDFPPFGGNSNALTIRGSSTFTNPYPWNAGIDRLAMTFKVTIGFTGGSVASDRVDRDFTAFTPGGSVINSSPGNVSAPGFLASAGAFTFDFSGINNLFVNGTVGRIDWRLQLFFTWHDRSPTDTLWINFPAVASVQLVPSPAIAMLAGMGGWTVARRQR